MDPALYSALAIIVAGAIGTGGILFWRSTNSQISANAKLASAQADKTDEERRGVATDNAKDLITLMEAVMEKQNARFETEVMRMKVQAESMTTASLRDKETIAELRKLIQEQGKAHEAAMAEERVRCDRAMAELHLRIDLLTKRVETNSTNIDKIDLGGATMLDTPVIITHAPEQ